MQNDSAGAVRDTPRAADRDAGERPREVCTARPYLGLWVFLAIVAVVAVLLWLL